LHGAWKESIKEVTWRLVDTIKEAKEKVSLYFF